MGALKCVGVFYNLFFPRVKKKIKRIAKITSYRISGLEYLVWKSGIDFGENLKKRVKKCTQSGISLVKKNEIFSSMEKYV